MKENYAVNVKLEAADYDRAERGCVSSIRGPFFVHADFISVWA